MNKIDTLKLDALSRNVEDLRSKVLELIRRIPNVEFEVNSLKGKFDNNQKIPLYSFYSYNSKKSDTSKEFDPDKYALKTHTHSEYAKGSVVESLKTNVEVLKGDINGIKSNMETFRGEIGGINQSIETINGEIEGINQSIDTMNTEMETIKENLNEFAKKTDLDGLATKDELAEYAKSTDLAEYAKSTDLAEYAKLGHDHNGVYAYDKHDHNGVYVETTPFQELRDAFNNLDATKINGLKQYIIDVFNEMNT